MIQYRSLQHNDVAGIIEGWNQNIWCDPLTETRFKNLILCDPNFDPEGLIIAEENGEILGALYALRRRVPMFGTELESDSGWITWFFVKDQAQRKGIGSQLLQKALLFLKKNKIKTVYFASYAPNYIVPGLDKNAYPEAYSFLMKNGFQKDYEAVAMDRNIVNYNYPEEVKEIKKQRESEGYSFEVVTKDAIPSASWFAHEKFNEDWGRAIREGLVRNVNEEQIIIARNPEKEIIGFTMFGGYEGIRERFGPFGVDENLRGLGIGKILLHECLFKQKQVGVHNSWFLWTGEESAAGFLYRKYGFEITRRFEIMYRTVN
ncbi:MAG: GNAT family N-acetyltransferase [Peptostreptococcaceae bacterium]|nr:GNAT family N-acetyltransferase [Peptostreptococcaceae bacterium]